MTAVTTLAVLREKYDALAPIMDERLHRLWAASEALALGWGGTCAYRKRRRPAGFGGKSVRRPWDVSLAGAGSLIAFLMGGKSEYGRGFSCSARTLPVPGLMPGSAMRPCPPTPRE
jgi:hypothetical protein